MLKAAAGGGVISPELKDIDPGELNLCQPPKTELTPVTAAGLLDLRHGQQLQRPEQRWDRAQLMSRERG